MDQKSTGKSFIANSFCEYFSTIARNLKSKPAEENLPYHVTQSQFTSKAVKESEILKKLKHLKRKKASGLDNFPPGLLKAASLSNPGGKLSRPDAFFRLRCFSF